MLVKYGLRVRYSSMRILLRLGMYAFQAHFRARLDGFVHVDA